MFDVCTTGDTAHIDMIFKFLPHTRQVCVARILGLFCNYQNFLSLLKFTYAHKFIEKETIVRFLVTMKVVLLQKESTHCYK
jgi:hypothetical protein